MFMINPVAESFYSILGLTPDASLNEISRAMDQLCKDLRRKINATGDKEEKQRLEKREVVINQAYAKLRRPKEREKYDRENAHLKLLMIRPAAVPVYTTPADRLYVFFRVIRGFLNDQGVDLPPWMDTERLDFTADWTRTELLDSLLNHQP